MARIIRKFIRENLRFGMGLDRFVTMNALSDVVGLASSTIPPIVQAEAERIEAIATEDLPPEEKIEQQLDILPDDDLI